MASQENPSAFPRADLLTSDGCGIREGADGMTLRDYFAGKFAGGCAASLTRAPETDEEFAAAALEIKSLARLSFVMADAMLAARVSA